MSTSIFRHVVIIALFLNTSFIIGQGTSVSSNNPTAAILSISNTMEQLAQILPGKYHNTKQHKTKPDDFYHVTMQVDRIWSDRDDANWFYVNQAQVDLQDHPFHETIYKIYRGNRDTLIVQIYDLPSNLRAIGLNKDDSFWKMQHPENLVMRKGCAIHLIRRQNAYFVGQTNSKNCPCICSIESAVAMQSQLTISLEALKVWHEGFDHKGEKVWGSAKGAYHFERFAEE